MDSMAIDIILLSVGKCTMERQHYTLDRSSHLQPILAYNLLVAVLYTFSDSCPLEVITTKPCFIKASIADNYLSLVLRKRLIPKFA